MKVTKILGILLIALFAVLMGCTRTVVVQQPDPNAQQMAPAQTAANQPDPTDPNNDQYWAQQSYYQWQQQNANRDFDYFLANVWALQTQRSYYYQNVFGYSTYSPPLTRYRYSYRNSYAPIVVNRTVINRTTVVRTPTPSMRVANSSAPTTQKSPQKFSSGGSNFPKSSGVSGGKFSNSGSSKIWKRK